MAMMLEKLTAYIGRDFRGIAVLLNAVLRQKELPHTDHTRIEAYFWNRITNTTKRKSFETAKDRIGSHPSHDVLFKMSRSWLNNQAIRAVPVDTWIAPDDWSRLQKELGPVFDDLAMEALPLVASIHKETGIPGLDVLGEVVANHEFIKISEFTDSPKPPE